MENKEHKAEIRKIFKAKEKKSRKKKSEKSDYCFGRRRMLESTRKHEPKEGMNKNKDESEV